MGDLSHSPVEVTVEGETFQVEVESLQPQRPARTRRGRGRGATPETAAPQSTSRTATSDDVIRSPMPGRIISILVRPGDQVSAGDELCVVEAMKMEQSILAHRNGRVKTIHVQPRDSVSAGDPLIELE